MAGEEELSLEVRLQLEGYEFNQVFRDDELIDGEIFWRDHQPWLKDKGYILRKRYQPDWAPSWNLPPGKGHFQVLYEDGVSALYPLVLDATRSSDGAPVALKNITRGGEEVAVGTLLSSEPLASHPANHCVPIYEVLRVPDDPGSTILVMPFLLPFDFPPFESIGEVVEFFRQIFNALKLMHDNHIAHRDIKRNNIMADTLHLFRSRPHPANRLKTYDYLNHTRVATSRTVKPVKYYLIDYGLSKVYKPEDAPFLEPPGWGGDKTVPEFKLKNRQERWCKFVDPFLVDVYCMGNMVRTVFLDGDADHAAVQGLGFMHDLVEDMVKDDPKQRPTMTDVVLRFEDSVRKLSAWKLRSRIVYAGEPTLPRILLSALHRVKQIGHMVQRLPPIPKP